MPSVFLIGPGLIGGEILALLRQDANYEITVLVRRESARPAFHGLGIKTVLGSLSDSSIITSQAAASNIIIHTATADDLPSVQAVMAGIAQRSKKSQETIYIHTSGASLIGDSSESSSRNEFVYDDATPEAIDALPDSAAHREIDLAIVNAYRDLSLASHAKLVLMIPPVIYGVGQDNRTSIQLPTLARYAIKHGYPGMIGKGLSVWNQVHVKDLARGYVTLLHYLEDTPASSVHSNPYFFCENGEELSWGECVAEIGRLLHKAGKVADPTPRTVPRENYGDLFGEYSGLVVGSNARNRATRLRALGWEPREKRTFASLAEDELPLILQERGEFRGYAAPVASGKFEGRK